MSNKLISLLIIICILFSLSACVRNDMNNTTTSSSTDVKPSDSETMPTISELQSNGTIGYDKLTFFNLCSTYKFNYFTQYLDTNLFPFAYNSLNGYCDEFGDVVISERYEYATHFSESKAFVKSGGKWKIIDKQGNELYTLPDGYNAYSDTMFFQNDIAVVAKKIQTDYMGIVGTCYDLQILVIKDDMTTTELILPGGLNLDYQIINTPEFAGIVIYNMQKNKVTNSYDAKYTMYDITGVEIWNTTIPNNEDIADELFNGLGNSGVFKYEGYSNIDAFVSHNGYMNIVDSNKKWGLFDLSSKEIIIPCNYDFVGTYSNGAVSVCSYGKWGYIDLTGSTVIAPTYLYANQYVNDKAIVITNESKVCIIDKTGLVISECNISLDSDMNMIIPFCEKSELISIASGRDLDDITIINTQGKILLSLPNVSRFYLSEKFIIADAAIYLISA